MSYLGDFALGASIDFKFTTRRFSTGAPFTLAGTPALAAYPDNSTTELTAGITLTVDFDSRTGLNNVRLVATSGNGYAAGVNYAVVITAGTVDSVSVVGEVVAHFSLENRAVSSLGTQAKADVNAEVVDALATDTYAEPGQGTPAATTTLAAKIGYLYKFLRNRVTVTGSTISVYNDDASTVGQKSTHSDDGTTYDRGEFTTGA